MSITYYFSYYLREQLKTLDVHLYPVQHQYLIELLEYTDQHCLMCDIITQFSAAVPADEEDRRKYATNLLLAFLDSREYKVEKR